MRYFKTVAAFLVLLSATAQCTNYCRASLCTKGRKHIACNNNGQFLAACPANARMVNLTPHKALLIRLHNEKRNLIAGGGVTGYKPAVRMATMQWDDELAQLAAYNVKQCQMKHDACRNTDKYRMSGQNLAYMGYTGAEARLNDASLIKNRVEAWFVEYKDCNMNYINKYPANYAGKQIGHFTVMVADHNIRLGCAASRYKVGGYNYFLIGCNYATTNIIGRSMYAAGATASSCKTGRNTAYKNLCSIKEVYTGL